MERPYNGIATLYESPTGYHITIPAKKHWPVIIFLSLWLVGWLMGFNFVTSSFGNDIDDIINGRLGFNSLFTMVWLIFWGIGGVFVIKTLIWYFIGKEIIMVDHDQISVARKNDIFSRQKIYDLQEAKRFHVEEEHFEFVFWGRSNDLGVFRNRGSIRFEYGLKTIKFANDMDEAEAKHILETLRLSGYLTAANFD
jgi:hypothetical protein